MALPRLFGVGLWLTATLASTAVVWTATSIVVADVTDRPAPVLAHDDVVSELASGSTPPEPAPAGVTPEPAPTGATPTTDPSPSTVPPPGRQPVPANPTPPPPEAAPLPATPGFPVAPGSPPVTVTPAPPPPPAPVPPNPPPPQPARRPTATYSTSGGVVTVACDGFFIGLVSAIPSDDYAVDVVAAGPGNVEVHFVRSGEDVSVMAFCFGEPIRYYDQDQRTQQPGTP